MKNIFLLIPILIICSLNIVFAQSWTQLGDDIDAEAVADRFGWSVSISPDGKRVAIGALNNDGIGNNAGHVRVYIDDKDLTLVENELFDTLPTGFIVLPAYPNPFNPSTTIRYGLANVETSHALSVQIQIYDIAGQLITTLLNGEQTPGWHSVIWNGTNQHGGQAPAGIYLSKITAGNDVKTTKLMLLK